MRGKGRRKGAGIHDVSPSQKALCKPALSCLKVLTTPKPSSYLWGFRAWGGGVRGVLLQCLTTALPREENKKEQNSDSANSRHISVGMMGALTDFRLPT